MRLKNLYLIILLFSWLTSLGQDTSAVLPVLTKNKIWTIAQRHWMPIPHSERSLKIWKDTLINGETFSCIISTDETKQWDTLHYYNLLREDQGKIFRHILFYDFSMKIGDTLIYSSDHMLVLDSIVNRMMINGVSRKHFYLSYFYEGRYRNTQLWIEGIGSLFALNQPIACADEDGAGDFLLCVHENGELIYQNADYSDCSIDNNNAGPIQNLVVQGKQWNYAEGSDLPEVVVNRYSRLLIDGDTLIGDQTYSCLFYQPDQRFTDRRLYGFLRETSAHKIYYHEVGSQSEQLLYDFSLAVGDSVYSNYLSGWLVLDSVADDPTGKKNWYYHQGSNITRQWIEGVGSVRGLLMREIVGGFSLLTCCTLNDSVLYQADYASQCRYVIRKPVLAENKTWSQINFRLPSFTAITEHLKISGDSIVGNNVYKRILKSTNVEQSNWKYSMLAREAADGSIYFKPDTAQNDYLFYRPDGAPGDTLMLSSIESMSHSAWINTYPFRIEGRDSIEIEGLNRARVTLRHINSPVGTWFIEGIGSASGLFHWDNGTTGGDGYKMICCTENGSFVYHDSSYPTCFYERNLSEDHRISNHLVKVSQLSVAQLAVEPQSGVEGVFMVYDGLGRQLVLEKLKQKKTIINLPKGGLLFYRFENPAGAIQTGKVLVK